MNFLNLETAVELLKSNEMTFREVVGKAKERRNYEELLEHKEFFKELQKRKLVTKDEYKYVFDRIETKNELDAFDQNSYLLRGLIKNKIASFEELVDKYVSIKNEDGESCLRYLLSNKSGFRYFIKNELISKKECEYLLKYVRANHELYAFNENPYLFEYSVKEGIVTFKELVDRYASNTYYEGSGLELLICKIFQASQKPVSDEELRYLLNKIDNTVSVHSLCDNAELLKYCFENFLIDIEVVDKFNELIKKYRDQDFFELVRDRNHNDDEVLKLSEGYEKLYSFVCSLAFQEKKELLEILKSSDRAKNNLQNIVESNVQHTYSFDQIKDLIIKDDEKKRIKLNF